MVRIKHKVICALRSEEQNENIDLWLTIHDKPVGKVLIDGH